MVKGPRGFTLIELITGSAVALIVLSLALAVFLQSAAFQRRQVELAAMKRSAALVLGQLGSELRQAGLGRPRHARAEGSNELFPPTLLRAEAQQLAFIADLPRPDSSFNGYSLLADDQSPGSLPANGVALLNELNGGCDITSASPRCTSDAESLLFPPAAGTDCGSDPAARTCPWSLNRYQGGEYLIVVGPMGRWVERRIAPGRDASSPGGRRALVLDQPLPADLLSGPNRGFVSTPDRVFYRLVADTVVRNQCWGSVGSPASGLATPCSATPGPGATGWEQLATGLSATGLQFTYRDAKGTVLATPVPAASLRRIHLVDVRLQLERALPDGDVVSHSAFLSITLRQ